MEQNIWSVIAAALVVLATVLIKEMLEKQTKEVKIHVDQAVEKPMSKATSAQITADQAQKTSEQAQLSTREFGALVTNLQEPFKYVVQANERLVLQLAELRHSVDNHRFELDASQKRLGTYETELATLQEDLELRSIAHQSEVASLRREVDTVTQTLVSTRNTQLDLQRQLDEALIRIESLSTQLKQERVDRVAAEKSLVTERETVAELTQKLADSDLQVLKLQHEITELKKQILSEGSDAPIVQ